MNSEGTIKLTDFGMDLSGVAVGTGAAGGSNSSRSVGKNNSSSSSAVALRGNGHGPSSRSIQHNQNDDYSLMTESDMSSSSIRGSFDYLAPECMIGGACSIQSDIWSFGVTIHAVAIGGYPYAVEKGDFWAILNALQEQPVPLPSSSDFSTDFVDFVRQVGGVCVCVLRVVLFTHHYMPL